LRFPQYQHCFFAVFIKERVKIYNKVVLVGHLTRDVEIKFTQSGLSIANTAIAANKKFKVQSSDQREEVMFIDITFFGRSAEVANQYLRKGSKILVEGRIKFDQWTDQHGAKRSKHSISVESMQMLDSKRDSEAYVKPQPTRETPSYTPEPRPSQMPADLPSIDIAEDPFPF